MLMVLPFYRKISHVSALFMLDCYMGMEINLRLCNSQADVEHKCTQFNDTF